VRVFKTFKLFNRCAPFKSFRAEASVQRSKVELFKVCASRRYLRRVFEAKKRFGLSVRNYMVTSSHVHLLVNDTGANFIAQSMERKGTRGQVTFPLIDQLELC
jgi:hypothetical protein